MYVEHEGDSRVLCKIVLDGLERAVVGAGVARIVVERAVVHHAKARLAHHLRHLVADADHVAARIRRAEGVRRLVFRACGHGVAL